MRATIIERIQTAKEQKLVTLSLSNFNIQELPEEIGELVNLTSLDLKFNQLELLPSSISNLRNLRKLHLSNNNFKVFPEAILGLENLQHLCLGDNQISSIPEGITRLEKLNEFILPRNLLTSLPKTITELSYLEHLCLGGNKLTQLPENIDTLVNMKRLHLQNNLISNLNFNLSNADFIQNMDLTGNPLIDPPMSLILRGEAAILRYYLDREKGGIFKIPVDVNFRTPLKQYLNYFNDFVVASKGVQVNFEVISYEEGLELNIKVNTEVELQKIKEYLQEYISFTKSNIDNLNPTFTLPVTDTKRDLVILDLRNQIRNLQSSIELRELEIRHLNRETDRMYELLLAEKKHPQTLVISNDSNAYSSSSNQVRISTEIKNELPQLQNEIWELKKILKEAGEEDYVKQLDDIDEKILAINECEQDLSKTDKVPFKKLKRILDEINNEDSTLSKTIKAGSKGIKAAQELAKTYNKFGQWLGLPHVPDIFLG
ncbi:MAG: leucine-rich repeat domain-containing protein [Chitinophagales bacterium]|nr:leucine-rich repeat domain-containing protein [Chitinophagales bacterium]